MPIQEEKFQYKREQKLQGGYSICCVITSTNQESLKKIQAHLETIELLLGVNPQKYISMKELYSKLVKKIGFTQKELNQTDFLLKLNKGILIKSGIHVSNGIIKFIGAFSSDTDTSCIVYSNGSIIYLSPEYSLVKTLGNDGEEHISEIGNKATFNSKSVQKLQKQIFA